MSQISEIKNESGEGSPSPMTVWAVHRNVTVTSQIVPQFTQGETLGTELLKIWDQKFAAVQFGMINSEKKSATLKIRLDDEWRPFVAKAEAALKKATDGTGASAKDASAALAYTPFGMGRYAQESPATMIQKGLHDELKAQYKFYAEHADRYPRNRQKMEGIKKAIQLYKEGKLENEATGAVTLFSKPLHINPYRKAGDRYFISSAKILYTGLQSPFLFEVQEGWAKGEKRDGSPLLLPVSGTLQMQKVSVAVSTEEFMNLIEKTKDTVSFLENERRRAVIESALEQERVQFAMRQQKKAGVIPDSAQKNREDYVDLL